MCRMLAYLGEKKSVEDLLYDKDNPFISQSYEPKFSQYLNLAGFGMVGWDPSSHFPKYPWTYRTKDLPFYDLNLKNLSRKMKVNSFLGHIRGTLYHEEEIINLQNVHPFHYQGVPIALAHNGFISGIKIIKKDLLNHVSEHFYQVLSGTTDSEIFYAIFMSYLEEPFLLPCEQKVIQALKSTVKCIEEVQLKNNITTASQLNFILMTYQSVYALKLTLNPGKFSSLEAPFYQTPRDLWFTLDAKDPLKQIQEGPKRCQLSSILISSEPLTHDLSTWLKIPEFSVLSVHLHEDRFQVALLDFEY